MVWLSDLSTREGRERMADWTAAWIQRELSCQPADWGAFEEGARRCYHHEGTPWPRVVIRVPSPLVGAVAAKAVLAALSPDLFQRYPVDHYPRQALGWAAFSLALLAADGGPASGAAESWLTHVRAASLPREAQIVAREAERMARDGQLRDSMSAAVARAVQEAFEQYVGGEAAPFGQGNWRPVITHNGAMSFQNWCVDAAIREAVDPAVLRAVDQGIAKPVAKALQEPLEMVVRVAVRRSAGALSSHWTHVGGWGLDRHAARGFLRAVCGVELPGDSWGRDLAYIQAASSAGWWWAHGLFVIASDRPSEIRLPAPRPHAPGWKPRPDEPVVVWRDGSTLRLSGEDRRIAPSWSAPTWDDLPGKSLGETPRCDGDTPDMDEDIFIAGLF